MSELTPHAVAGELLRDENRREQWTRFGLYKGEELAPAVARRVDAVLAAAGPDLSVIDGASEQALDLAFVWSHDLADSELAEIEWIWRGLLAVRSVGLIVSAPKCGKSTLIGGMLGAFVAEDVSEFLGREVATCEVVYLSEEGAPTLREKLPAGVRTLARDGAFPKPSWPELLENAAAESVRIGGKVLVVDTFRFWGGLTGDQEKSSGYVQPLLDKAAEIASKYNLAVLIVHHSRKGGGEDGEAASGTNAIVGGVDVVLELERVGDHALNQRSINGLSRFHETPGSLVYEWSKSSGDFKLIGEGEDRSDGKRASLGAHVLTALSDAGEPLTRGDLEEVSGCSWKQILSALDPLLKSGFVARSGKGRAGDPYLYQSVQHRDAQTGTDVGLMSVPPLGGTDTDTECEASQHRDVSEATDAEQATAERVLETYGADAA